MPYVLEYKNSVKKELRKLGKANLTAIIHKINKLKTNPRPNDSAKLKGSTNLFRIRHGNYRVIYQINKNVLIVTIITIGHRKEIYKKL